ncbi:helix-turn-helix domain-containing protein [Streptomyces sp. NPDC088387]|uniref:AraC family transcriptional regulator n=1 Tax=Streptomyces sp. NPDC088387 TaxID=3365859 RepID=UPI00381DE10B
MSADDLPRTAVPGNPSPPPGLVVAGHFDQYPGYSVSRPRGSDSWLFTWTTGGRGRLRQGATEVRTGPGELVALAPGVRQSYAVAPRARHWRFWWAHCRARASWLTWLRPYEAGDGVYVVGPVAVGLHGRVESAFRRLLTDARWTGEPPAPEPPTPSEAGGPDPGDPHAGDPHAGDPHAGDPHAGDPVAVAHAALTRELALGALEEAVLLTAGTVRATTSVPGVDARLLRAQTLIAADPGAPHTVASLAAGVALSPSRFAHLYTRQLGESPMRALREARLQYAARLLEGSDLSVERVAAASGFASPFHFNRVFHERYGVPPGAYRAAHR